MGAAIAEPDVEPRYLADVVNQVNNLAARADAMGLIRGTSPNPSGCKHYQGMERVLGADGTSFIYLSRSGNTPDIGPGLGGLLCDDSPGETENGHLVVFRMGSRNTSGERLRNNRLQRGQHVDATLPNLEDAASIYFTVVDGGLVFRDGPNDGPIADTYQHPGGMQLVGNVLALALETPRDTSRPPGVVMFLDVSVPEDPQFLSQYELVDQNGAAVHAAGTLGVARLPDDHYLMAVTGGSNNPVIHFYRSSATSLADPSLDWHHADAWVADVNQNLPSTQIDICALSGSQVAQGGVLCLSADEQYLGQNWPDGNTGHTHQTLQFLRETDIGGTLYLGGVRGKIGSDDSYVDVYRVDCLAPACDGGDIRLRHMLTKGFDPYPNTGGNKLASFAAASTLYTSPSGELILYVGEHDNDGPRATSADSSGSIMIGEWRHRNGVRTDSPTLLPTARIDGPVSVAEGSTVNVTGSASAPVTRAFVQLFHGTDFTSYSVMADVDDAQRDDFDNLFLLEQQVIFGSPPAFFTHHNKARSWTWYAPPGCSIVVADYESGSLDQKKTLTTAPGDPARVQRVADLATVPNDDGQYTLSAAIDVIHFTSPCTAYYADPFELAWDMNGDGTFEVTGTQATFDAALLDGPSFAAVDARARHPWAGGPEGIAAGMIEITNVAPALDEPGLTDSAGYTIGTQVPFVLVGQAVTVAAGFTDPGLPDRQTASVDWGDGVAMGDSAFSQFDEAFGDGSGNLAAAHAYVNGGDYTVAVSVSDDDGGSAFATAALRVLTPAEALAEIADMLGGLIAATGDSKAKKDLEKALKALIGSNPRAANGALNMLAKGNVAAAKAMLRQALRALDEAGGRGVPVAMLLAILQQVDAVL